MDARGTTPNAKCCWYRQRDRRFLYSVSRRCHLLFPLLLGAAVTYSRRAVRRGFELFVDIVVYPEMFFGKGIQMPEARPQIHDVVVVDIEKTGQSVSGQKVKQSFLFCFWQQHLYTA